MGLPILQPIAKLCLIKPSIAIEIEPLSVGRCQREFLDLHLTFPCPGCQAIFVEEAGESVGSLVGSLQG
ncbi:MAG: hypothetical protein ACK55I_48685, partial [bacterium]